MTAGPKRRRLCILSLWATFAAGTGPLFSFETDQYLALGVEIADSAEPVNRYFNQELEEFLGLSRVGALECAKVPVRFYRSMFRGLLASRFKKHLKTDPAIDRFPEDWTYFQYLGRSIYRKPWFPFLLPLSPTIQIGEVRFGLDKFGHFLGFGRSYYRRYRKHRARGVPEAEAVRRVVRRGVQQERFFVGGLTDGVFSYADLEANYQGMELAKDFCLGDDSYLERDGDRWRLRRRIDLRDYVTPAFDESYNNNHYPWPRWNLVRPILVTEYCEVYFSPAVQARMERYRELDRSNPSKRFIAEYFARKGHDLQARQSMESICEVSAER